MSEVCTMSIQLGPLSLNADTGRLRHEGREQKPNHQQQLVLERLARKPGTVVTIEQLLAAMYADARRDEPESSDNILANNIHAIRKSLAALGGQMRIVNRPRCGYWLEISP